MLLVWLFHPPVLLADQHGNAKRRDGVVFRGKAVTGARAILYRVPFLVKSFFGFREFFELCDLLAT
jgi:hypothetical protein